MNFQYILLKSLILKNILFYQKRITVEEIQFCEKEIFLFIKKNNIRKNGRSIVYMQGINDSTKEIEFKCYIPVSESFINFDNQNIQYLEKHELKNVLKVIYEGGVINDEILSDEIKKYMKEHNLNQADNVYYTIEDTMSLTGDICLELYVPVKYIEEYK